MSETGDRDLLIEEEMRDSYLTYAMSVLIDRALPDIRDGLKPVHRRILFAMRDLNLNPGSKYEIGKIVGSVSVTITRDAAVDAGAHGAGFLAALHAGGWPGKHGSIDGDPPAAYRYTEARMMSGAAEMLADIQYDTVDHQPNFDESREEPTVLPSRLPNLLVNGSSGIAVGMATYSAA